MFSFFLVYIVLLRKLVCKKFIPIAFRLTFIAYYSTKNILRIEITFFYKNKILCMRWQGEKSDINSCNNDLLFSPSFHLILTFNFSLFFCSTLATLKLLNLCLFPDFFEHDIFCNLIKIPFWGKNEQKKCEFKLHLRQLFQFKVLISSFW